MKIVRQPVEAVFALLDYCGIRPRDIAKRLGVSQTLVSLWRSGGKSMAAHHHAALIAFAVETIDARFRAFQEEMQQEDLPHERIVEICTAIGTFRDLVNAARAERDPALLRDQLQLAIPILASLVGSRGTPMTLDQHHLDLIERYAQQVVTAARLLRTHLPVAEVQPSPQLERLLANLSELLATWRGQLGALPGES